MGEWSGWTLRNPVVVTTGLTALAALATLAYNIWQDHRWLRIDLKPVDWAYSPIDRTGTKFRVDFFFRVIASNPGRTPNRIADVTVWRDGTQVEPVGVMLEENGEIAPFELATLDFHVTPFESVDDPQRAFESISTIEIEVKALRGCRRTPFEPQAFLARLPPFAGR